MKRRAGYILRLAAAGLLVFVGVERVRLRRSRADDAVLQTQVETLRRATSLIVARHPKSQAWKDSAKTTEWVGSLVDGVSALKAVLAALPDQRIPELAFVSDAEWLVAAARLPAEPSADDLRECVGKLQGKAKEAFAVAVQKALNTYLGASGGRLPQSLSELAPDLGDAYDDSLSDRYALTRQGSVDLAANHDGAVYLIASVPDAMKGEFNEWQTQIGRHDVSESGDAASTTPTFSIPPSLPPVVQSALAGGVLAYMRSHGGALPSSNHALKPYVQIPPGSDEAKQIAGILDHEN